MPCYVACSYVAFWFVPVHVEINGQVGEREREKDAERHGERDRERQGEWERVTEPSTLVLFHGRDIPILATGYM